MIESAVTRSCLSYLGSLPHVKLWRNHSGLAVFQSGMTCRVGIPSEGGGDYLGFESEVIDDEWFARNKGKKIAVFSSVEFKRTAGGRTAEKQKRWRDFVLASGGRAVVISSVEEAKRLFPIR